MTQAGEATNSTPPRIAVRGQQFSLSDVSYSYGRNLVLDRMTLTVGAGEFFTLLGPSGCGKTTTLRLVAGLMAPSSGTIHFGERDVTAVAVHKRGIAMVFQNYALMPHLTVLDNVAYGLKMRGFARSKRYEKAAAALAMVGLVGYEDRYITALSGGQQQRVGLARAVAVESGIMLLDEPLSNLDTSLRQQMCGELRELQQKLGVTILYVTHDRSEALSMSDRVGVMSHGSLLDVNSPEELYRAPRYLDSARLLGDVNELRLTAVSPGTAVTEGGHPLRLPETAAATGGRLVAGVRPERLRLLADGEDASDATNVLDGVLIGHEFAGATHTLTVRVSGFPAPVAARIPEDRTPADGLPRPGETVRVCWRVADTIVFEENR